jgi:hypothetical protein
MLTHPHPPSTTAVRSTNRLRLRGSISGPWSARPQCAPTAVSFLDCNAYEGRLTLIITSEHSLPSSRLLFSFSVSWQSLSLPSLSLAGRSFLSDWAGIIMIYYHGTVWVYPDMSSYVQLSGSVQICPVISNCGWSYKIRSHPSLPSLVSSATSRVIVHGNHRHYVMILTIFWEITGGNLQGRSGRQAPSRNNQIFQRISFL